MIASDQRASLFASGGGQEITLVPAPGVSRQRPYPDEGQRSDASCTSYGRSAAIETAFAIRIVQTLGNHVTSREFSMYLRRVWTADDIEIILDDDLTDDPVVTAHILTPAGELLAMAEVEVHDRELVLRGLHMHGVTLRPNELGWPRLRQLARAVMEGMDVDAIVIEGAVRTSGARRGHVPRTLRFTRRISTAG